MALILRYIGTRTLSCHQSIDGAAVLLEICHETLHILLLLLSVNLLYCTQVSGRSYQNGH